MEIKQTNGELKNRNTSRFKENGLKYFMPYQLRTEQHIVAWFVVVIIYKTKKLGDRVWVGVSTQKRSEKVAFQQESVLPALKK